MGFDLVIVNDTAIDGTCRPDLWSDSDICSGGIASIIAEGSPITPQTLNGTDLIISSGVIDAHLRSHWILPILDQVLAPLLLQKVTAIVTDNRDFFPSTGPKFNRDGSIRAQWGRPVAYAILDR